MNNLYTFLFTDIEGSTGLWEKHPDAMRVALARHDELLKKLVESHQGRIVKSTGDGILAAFDDAVQAAAGAVAIQQALAAEPWPEDIGQLKVRMGLHTGAGEARGGDYFGPELNRAARIMDAGHGGQILLSSVTRELIANDLPANVTVMEMGEHRLKGISKAEYLHQLTHADLVASFPQLRTLSVLKHNLPVQLTSFVGREKELSEVLDLLKNTHLLTLLGPGGTGKSRLQLRVGEEVVQHYKDGVWLVELAQITDADMIPVQMAAALRVQEQANRDMLTAITDYLKHREMLLLLDNVEHLVRASAKVVEHLLRNCPKLKILVTGREALFISGETTVQIPSLSLPEHNGKSDLETICAAESVQLFHNRAQAVRPEFSVTAENSEAVAKIVERLDGIPLALELAAARLRMMSVEQIAERLDDRFRLLTGGSRTAMPRQQTLEALIDWSWQLLEEDEQAVLRRLSVFTGGWTLEASQKIVTDDALDEYAVFDHLEQLVNKSLVVVDHGSGEDTRYRMLESIRQFARDQLLAAGESEALRDRHAEYFIELAGVFEEKFITSEYIVYHSKAKAELDNFRSVLTWTLEEEPELALELLAKLLISTLHLMTPREVAAWLGPTLEKTRPLYENGDERIDPAHFGQAVMRYGLAFASQGLANKALPYTNEGIEILARTDRKDYWAYTIFWKLGQVIYADAWYDELIDLSKEAVEVCHENGYDFYLGMGTTLIGYFYVWKLEDFEEGMKWIMKGYKTMDKVGHPRQLAEKLTGQGLIAWRMGDHQKSIQLYEASRDLYEKVDDQAGKYRSQAALGHGYRILKQTARSADMYREAIQFFQDSGQYPAVAHLLECFGYLSIQQEAYAPAAQLIGAAMAIREELDARITMPHEVQDFEEGMGSLRQGLREAELEQALADGREMSIEDAVQFALGQEYGER